MTITVSPTFLRHQAPNIVGFFGAGLRSALPVWRRQVDTPTPPVQRRLRPIPRPLIDAYAAWTGAPPERYADTVPPHMFSYWALSLIAQLTGQAPYNLLAAVNQGCNVHTRALLPADEALEVTGYLADINDDGRRVRLATHLEVGTASVPDAQRIEVIAAVPRRNPKGGKPKADRGPEPAFDTVGHWSAGADDGLNFALLTGDFNPLHTLPPVGRRTRYGSCILHGFGQLTRTWETIVNAGIEIGDFDIRYVKPVPLPTEALEVQVARETTPQGTRALRLRSPGGAVHMAGHLQEPGAEQS